MGAHTSILDPFPLRLPPTARRTMLAFSARPKWRRRQRKTEPSFTLPPQPPPFLPLIAKSGHSSPASRHSLCLAHPILLQELRPSHDPPYHPCSQPANSFSLANQALHLYFCQNNWESSCSNSICHGNKVWKEFQISCCGGMKGRRPCLPPRSTCLS